MSRRVFAARLLFSIAWMAFLFPRIALAQAARALEEPEAARLIVEPEWALRGDPVTIRIVGAPPNRPVVVRAERQSAWRSATYRATATFRSDGQGRVDLSSQAPISAPWTGIDPRGLLWSMTRTDEEPEDPTPWSQIHLFADVDGDGLFELEASLELARGRDDLVETALGDDFPGAFLLRPPGDEPLPVIITLGGSEGGDSAARGAAPGFASRGYAAVGLPYYSPLGADGKAQFPDLPQAFHEIPLERLEAVRDWLRERSDVQADRIGLWGVSKGAEFVLAAASRIEGFSAVAAIVPSDVIWQGWGADVPPSESSSFSFRGEALPFVPYLGMVEEFSKRRRGQAVRLRLPHDAGRLAAPERAEAARIEVEKIAAPVFVVGGDQDDTWDSGGMARNIAEAREAVGLETVIFVSQRAGHQLSRYGDSPATDADAKIQGEAFPALLDFFAEHLKEVRSEP